MDARVILLSVPRSERVPPLTLRLTTRCRRLRSAALLSEGTAGSATKTKSPPVSSTGQAMEDVLDLYAEPYDPDRPVVCFDETSTQLLAEVREPLPLQPERPRRQDYEYRRGGTRNIFLTCEPLAGWRHLAITERRTMQDFAHQMRWLVDEAYPDAPYGQRGARRCHTPYSSSRSRSVRSTWVITSLNASEFGGSSRSSQPG